MSFIKENEAEQEESELYADLLAKKSASIEYVEKFKKSCAFNSKEQRQRLHEPDHDDYCFKKTLAEFKALQTPEFLESHTDYSILKQILDVRTSIETRVILYRNGISFLDRSPNGQYDGFFNLVDEIIRQGVKEDEASLLDPNYVDPTDCYPADIIEIIKARINEKNEYGITPAQYSCIVFTPDSFQFSLNGLKALVNLGMNIIDEDEPGISLYSVLNKYDRLANIIGGGELPGYLEEVKRKQIAENVAIELNLDNIQSKRNRAVI